MVNYSNGKSDFRCTGREVAIFDVHIPSQKHHHLNKCTKSKCLENEYFR